MKILFLSAAEAPDYQCDAVFHGLRSLYGENCVDYKKLTYLYKTYDDSNNLYGKGFSLYKILDDIEIDRTDFKSKILNSYFDFIIFGCVYGKVDVELIDYILTIPTNSRYIFIDGSDARQQAGNYYYLQNQYLSKGLYFKREMLEDDNRVIPISFGIPKEKIKTVPSHKTYCFAPLVPGNNHKNTYIYQDEESYYLDYQKSYFAYTCKKGGWDCMRHLEIMAAGTLPYFLDIEKCPKNTMHLYNKDMLHKIKLMKGLVPGIVNEYTQFPFIGNQVREDGWIDGVAGDYIKCGEDRGYIDFSKFNLDLYNTYLEILTDHLFKYHTTEALAKYIWKYIQ